MRCDALIAGAQDRVDAVDAVNRAAARTGFALVAGRGNVVEIIAAGALQQISARWLPYCEVAPTPLQGSRGIASDIELPRAGRRLWWHWSPSRRGEDRHHEGLRSFSTAVRVMSHQLPRPRNVGLHQVDQIRPASYKFGGSVCFDVMHRVIHAHRKGISERSHDCAFPSLPPVEDSCPRMTCCTAFTMPGYAPHRQRFPLISSRISSVVLA